MHVGWTWLARNCNFKNTTSSKSPTKELVFLATFHLSKLAARQNECATIPSGCFLNNTVIHFCILSFISASSIDESSGATVLPVLWNVSILFQERITRFVYNILFVYI